MHLIFYEYLKIRNCLRELADFGAGSSSLESFRYPPDGVLSVRALFATSLAVPLTHAPPIIQCERKV